MEDIQIFKYYHPIIVRFADLDPQGHVNNVVFLTYLESARLGYYEKVGIWKKESGMITGFVVARNEINYLAPITFGQPLRVGLRVERLGTKSLTFAFQMEAGSDGGLVADGKSVMVAYDGKAAKGIPIPPGWRQKIIEFEEMEENGEAT
jgi:acyl-CoA thioester hydrolase